MEQMDKADHLFFDDEKYEEFMKDIVLNFKKVYGQSEGTLNNLLLGELLLKASDNFYKLSAEKRDSSRAEVPLSPSGSLSTPVPYPGSGSGPDDDDDDDDLDNINEYDTPIYQNIPLPPPKPQEILKYKIIRNPSLNSITITPVPVSKLNTKDDVSRVKQNGPIILIKPSKTSSNYDSDNSQSQSESVTSSSISPAPVASGKEFIKLNHLDGVKCSIGRCNYIAKDLIELKDHRSVQHKEPIYPCKECDKTFRYKTLYESHQHKHSGIYPYKCQTCSKSFVSRNYLTLHLKTTHGIGNITHKCDICNVYYESNKKLITHTLIEHGGKTSNGDQIINDQSEVPFLCVYHNCNTVFRSKISLEAHQNKTHLNRSYPCTFDTSCGKLFHHDFYLKTHLRTVHEKHHKHFCSVCSAGFLQKSQKRLHEKVHRNEKDHICPYPKCAKAFFRVNRLTQHIMVNHTNVRPYNCTFCSKAFVNRSRLKRHQLLHSSEGGHCCDFCGEKYAVKESLRLHVLAKHTEKTIEGEKTVSSTTSEVKKKRNTGRKRKVKFLVETSIGQTQNDNTSTDSFICSNKNGIENDKLPIQDQIIIKPQSQLNQQQQQILVQQQYQQPQQQHQQVQVQVLQSQPQQQQPILPSYNSLTLSSSIFSNQYIKYPTSTTVISNVPSTSSLLQQQYQYQIPMITIPTQNSTTAAPQSDQSQFGIIYQPNPNPNMVTIAGENLNYQSICNILDSI